MVLGVSFAFANPVKADAISDLQAQVQALLAQIASLQGGSTTTTTTSGTGFTFTRNHMLGQSGGEIMEIQKFLNSHGAVVASTGAGSPGNESSYFGAKTKAAVAAWQAANGISPAAGYWGPLTRAKANSKANSMGGGTGTTPTGTGITVSAVAQPANSLVPQNASRVPFTTFTIMNTSGAPVTINGVNVMRTGPANDAAFNGGGVVLLDEMGMQLGVQRTFNSDHTVVAGDPFTIPAGATKTITVAGNFTTGPNTYSGQVASITVTGISTSVPVAGVLPITGASHTFNGSLTIGTVTPAISAFDPNSAQTKNIGDTAVKFSGIRFTAGSAEDVKLYSVRFRLNGSVSSGDLGNVVAIVDGTSYPTTISTDGRYYTVSFAGGLLIQKGFSKDVYLQGDILGGNASGRIVEFDIDKKTDVYFVGQTYGYGITPDNTFTGATPSTASTHATGIYGSGTTAAQPWFQGSTVSITGASITTIGKANEVAAANIAVNVSNVVLGGFATDLKGEGVTVQQMIFNVATSSTGSGLLTNVSIVDANGSVVAGPVDQAADGTITFTNTVTFPVGRKVYTLKGKVWSSASDGGTIYLYTNPGTQWTGVTGQTTGNSVTLPSGSFNMNTMTIRGATLAVNVSATPAAQTVVAGTQNLVFANFQLDASQSGEDIRVSNLPVTITATTTANLTYLSSCRVYDGTTPLTSGVNPTAVATNMIFDNSITVAKGTVKTLSFQCNVSSNAWGGMTFQVGWTSGSSINATGLGSSNTVTVTSATQAGQVMTIGSASLAVSLDTSSPSQVLVAGGTTGVTLGAYKFRASNDNVSLQRIGLTLTSGSSADLSTVTLWQGGTQVGSATFAPGAANATSTLTTPVTLTKDVDTVITVKGDIAGIGTSLPGTSGNTIKVDVNTSGSNTQGVGIGSGSQINATGSTAVSGITIYKSFPVFARVDLYSGTLTTGTVELYRFSVTPNSAGSVNLAQVTVNLATSTATAANGSTVVSNVKVYAYTDSGLSNPIGQGFTQGLLNATPVAAPINGDNKVAFDALVQISAGSPMYFKVVGDVAQVAGTSGAAGSVTSKITGDAAIYALASSTAAKANRNFVWSPNSTTTSLTTNDWTGGFLVSGLPAAGSGISVLTK